MNNNLVLANVLFIYIDTVQQNKQNEK